MVNGLVMAAPNRNTTSDCTSSQPLSHSVSQSLPSFTSLLSAQIWNFAQHCQFAPLSFSLSLFLSLSILYSLCFSIRLPRHHRGRRYSPLFSLSLSLFLSCISHPLGACKCCCIHKHPLPDVASVSLRSLISETDVSVNVFSVFFVVIHQLMGFRFFQFVPVCNICMNLSSFKQKQSCSSLQAPQLSASTTFSTFKATVTK